MFNEFTSTQPNADRLKYMTRGQKRGQRAFMDALQRFERCGWQPRTFADAAGDLLATDGDEIQYQRGDERHMLVDVTEILERYLTAVGCVPAQYPDPMGIEDAAKYLGMMVDGVKRLVHRTGQIVPIKQGHTLLFSKAMLDAYKADRRKAGRPKKAVEE